MNQATKKKLAKKVVKALNIDIWAALDESLSDVIMDSQAEASYMVGKVLTKEGLALDEDLTDELVGSVSFVPAHWELKRS